MAKAMRLLVKDKTSGELKVDDRDADLLRGKWYLRIDFGRASAYHFEPGKDKFVKRSLHRIVAERHLPKPGPEFEFVEALNGNKLDCRVQNLEWRRADDTNYKRMTRGAPIAPGEEQWSPELAAEARYKGAAVKAQATLEERRLAAIAKAERYAARKKEYDEWQRSQISSTKR